jgi:phage-related holin
MPHRFLIFTKVVGSNFTGLLFTYLVSFFTPIAWWLLAIGFFVVADFITGILKAKKNGGKIESNKMFRTIPKFVGYGLGIIVAHVITILFFPEFPTIKLMAGFIAFIEVKSIDENITVLTGYSLFGDIIRMLNPKRNQDKPNNGNDKGE